MRNHSHHETELGLLAVLVAGELVSNAEAAQPTPNQDQLQPSPAALAQNLSTAQTAGAPVSLTAVPVMVFAAADLNDRALPTTTQYIGGELQQMNMR